MKGTSALIEETEARAEWPLTTSLWPLTPSFSTSDLILESGQKAIAGMDLDDQAG